MEAQTTSGEPRHLLMTRCASGLDYRTDWGVMARITLWKESDTRILLSGRIARPAGAAKSAVPAGPRLVPALPYPAIVYTCAVGSVGRTSLRMRKFAVSAISSSPAEFMAKPIWARKRACEAGPSA